MLFYGQQFSCISSARIREFNGLIYKINWADFCICYDCLQSNRNSFKKALDWKFYHCGGKSTAKDNYESLNIDKLSEVSILTNGKNYNSNPS